MREIRVPRRPARWRPGASSTRAPPSQLQLLGGMIWGVSSALYEATEVDMTSARYINDNLADYLVPVNANIGSVDIALVRKWTTR